MVSSLPKITLHNLNNSDGSALYTSSSATHTLQSAVHYPLEVPYRSDETPNDTYIEVSLRPHNAVAMVKERHIEETVRKVLRSVVLGEETPRCMLQATVQVIEVETDEELSGGIKGGGQGEGYLDLLVGAINASVLSCLDGGVQMKGLAAAILIGISQDGLLKVSPNVKDRKRCTSIHAFGFSSVGECILMESQGRFEIEEWESAEKIARSRVCGDNSVRGVENGDVDMGDRSEDQNLFDLIRSSVQVRVTHDERWKV